jgi:hypothetical protein
MAATPMGIFVRLYQRDPVGNKRSRTYNLNPADDVLLSAAEKASLATIVDKFITGLTSLIGVEITSADVGVSCTEAAGAPLKPADGADDCSMHSEVSVAVSNSSNPDVARNVKFMGCYRDLYIAAPFATKKTILPVNASAAPSTAGEFLHRLLTANVAGDGAQFIDAEGNAVDTTSDGLHSTRESFTSPGRKEG